MNARRITNNPMWTTMVPSNPLAWFEEVLSVPTSAPNYPPYNIVKTDNETYNIQLAVAGFNEDELEVELNGNKLTVTGNSEKKEEGTYLHRGIASRSFQQTYKVANGVEVVYVELEDGILTVNLKHELPEKFKPKKFDIKTKREFLAE